MRIYVNFQAQCSIGGVGFQHQKESSIEIFVWFKCMTSQGADLSGSDVAMAAIHETTMALAGI
jgi:hypothetical protein